MKSFKLLPCVLLLYAGGCGFSTHKTKEERVSHLQSHATEIDKRDSGGNSVGLLEPDFVGLRESIIVDKGVVLVSTSDSAPMVHQFQVHNSSEATVRVELGNTSCNCTVATVSSDELPPNGVMFVDVSIRGNSIGHVRESASLLLSSGKRLTMGLTAHRLPILEVEKPPDVLMVPPGKCGKLELELIGRAYGGDSSSQFSFNVIDGTGEALAVVVPDSCGWELKGEYAEVRGHLQVVVSDPIATLGISSISRRIGIGFGDEEREILVAWKRAQPIYCEPDRLVIRTDKSYEVTVVLASDTAFAITDVHTPPFLKAVTKPSRDVQLSHILEFESTVGYSPSKGFERDNVVVWTSDVRQQMVEIPVLCWSISAE